MAYFEHFGTLDSGAWTTGNDILDSIVTDLGGDKSVYYSGPAGANPLAALSVSWAPTSETGTWQLYDDLRNPGNFPRVGLDNTGAAVAAITFTNGSATVTGVNTTFLADLKADYYLRTTNAGTVYQIQSVDSNTSLTLTTTFAEANFTGYATYCGPYATGTDPFIQCLTMTCSIAGTVAPPGNATAMTGTSTNFSTGANGLTPVGYYFYTFMNSFAALGMHTIASVTSATALALSCPTYQSGGNYTQPPVVVLPDCSQATQWGTALFTNGSTTVTGTNTLFLYELAVGSWIRTSYTGNWYQVANIVSNTSLTLRWAFQEATTTSTSFSVLRRTIILKCTSTMMDYFVKLSAPCDGRHTLYPTVLDSWNNSTHTTSVWNRSTMKMRNLADRGFGSTGAANPNFSGSISSYPIATIGLNLATDVGYTLNLLPEAIFITTTANTYQGRGTAATDLFFAQHLIPYYTIANGFPSNDIYTLCHGGSGTTVSRGEGESGPVGWTWPQCATDGALRVTPYNGNRASFVGASNVSLYKRADGTGGPWLTPSLVVQNTVNNNHSYGFYPRHRTNHWDQLLNGTFPNSSIYFTVLDCIVRSSNNSTAFVPIEPTIQRGEFRYLKVPCQNAPNPSRVQIKENGIYTNYLVIAPTAPDQGTTSITTANFDFVTDAPTAGISKFISSFDNAVQVSGYGGVFRNRILAIPQA